MQTQDDRQEGGGERRAKKTAYDGGTHFDRGNQG